MANGSAFLALGTALALLFWDLAWRSGPMGGSGYLTRMALAAVVYALAFDRIRRGRCPSPAVLLTCLALALAARVPLVLKPAGQKHDTHRYIWDARLQRAGVNPYVVRPDDPAYAALQTDATRSMNNRDVPSPYPPGAQYFFRAVTGVGESAVVIRAALVAAEAVTVAALWVWLVGRGMHPAWTLVYAWHPVVIFETASGGHLDALGVMFLVVSLAALARRRPATGIAAAVASVSVKFVPVVLAPLLLRRLRWGHAALGAAGLALLYLPFVEGWRLPTGSLGDVVARFRFNQFAFAPLEQVIGARAAAGVAVAAGLGTALALRRRASEGVAWAWPMAVSLLFAPVVYPWYLIWLVPFSVERWTRPLLVWSIAVIPTYRVWALGPGQPWAVPAAIQGLEYGALALAVAVLYFRPTRTSAPPP